MMHTSCIDTINGPVVTVRGAAAFEMLEMVYVGKKRLIGEVIAVSAAATTIQVYESTTGLHPGEPVEGTGAPLCATLGPGILQNIFDGPTPVYFKFEDSGQRVRAPQSMWAMDHPLLRQELERILGADHVKFTTAQAAK